MKLVELGLEEGVARRLVEGVSTGAYNLLLGAGFSMTAKGGDGEDLPSAWALAKDLNDRYELEADEQEFSRLSTIYGDALHSKKGREHVLGYLRTRFTKCEPSWQGDVLDFDWMRVWTLNIDDVLQVASKESIRKWRVDPISHVEELRAADPKSGKVQVVHLHGKAENIKGAASDLIFSLPEYSEAGKGRGDWLSEFWSSWLQKPFIVIGAKLLEEYDLAGGLERGTQAEKTTGYSTVIVLRDVSDREVKRLSRNGPKVLRASGEDFINALRNDLDSFFADNPGLAAGLSPNQIATFNSQFEVLATGSVRASVRHDFFSGDEPSWSDVESQRDAILDVTKNCDRYLSVETVVPRAVVLLGRPGGGKSTALLRIARSEIGRTRSVALFRADRELDPDASLAWAKAKKRSTFIFDNATDYSESIGIFLKKAREAKVDLNIICAERKSRSKALIADLSSHAEPKTYDYGLVKKTDVRSIVGARRKYARLGVGTSWSDAEWDSHFISRHKGDLFSALSEIEGGSGFYGRMDREVRALTADSNIEELRLLLAAAIVHRNGYSLPLGAAQKIMSESRPGSERGIFTSAVESLVEFDRHGIRLRHRMLAERFVQKFADVTDRFHVSNSIARSLGALITPNSMGSKDYSYLALRSLMDQEAVRSLLGSIHQARLWFDSLENVFDWNGRYWDQRALLESEAGAHGAAYSYAKKSVDLHSHPFAYTTLGTVRCRAALFEAAHGDLDKAWDYFAEGNASLLESESISRGRGFAHEHPFVTFFNAAVDFLPKIPFGDFRRSKLNAMADEWRSLGASRASSPRIVALVENKYAAWKTQFMTFSMRG